MMKNFLVAGTFVIASALAAQTASAAEYYVVRDATTKKCTDEADDNDHYCR